MIASLTSLIASRYKSHSDQALYNRPFQKTFGGRTTIVIFFKKAYECTRCTFVGKKMKTEMTNCRFRPLRKCEEANEELQVDLTVPILDDFGLTFCILFAID